MLGHLFNDKNGDKCGAKTLNTITFAIILTKITLSSVVLLGHQFATVTPADVQAFVMLLGVTNATYAARSHTKSAYPGAGK